VSTLKTAPDSTMFKKRSKLYNDRECRSVEWERALAGKEPIHSTFIILNRHIL
jgi:hypothetical protein